MRPRIGLFFGSFDPVHCTHLSMALCAQRESALKAVWFVPTPESPVKKAVASFGARCEMLLLALQRLPFARIEDLEGTLPNPQYTAHTLRTLSSRHPGHTFCLMLGEDNIHGLPQWRDADYIQENYEMLLFPRRTESPKDNNRIADPPSLPQGTKKTTHLRLMPFAPSGISSSLVRRRIRAGKDASSLLPPAVYELIRKKKLYGA